MAIKVFIQTKKFEGGPAVFRSRLIDAFDKFDDIEIVTNLNKPFDIELAFIRKVFRHNKPYILRVDGCYYEERRKSGNRNLERAILDAKYSIFQSEFAWFLCRRILNIKDKVNKEGVNHSIVYNGIDKNYINDIKPDESIPKGSFICSAGWRENKRPISTIEGFLKANTGRHLYMVGGGGFVRANINKKYNSKYVHILGEKTNEETISIMKSCDYQIHLCHIDSCPNSVIEGLACGLNVLCTNLGGTPTLVYNRGIVLHNIDKFWGEGYLKSCKLDNLPLPVVSDGIKALMKLPKKEPLVYDINDTAKQYRKIIKRVVRNNHEN